ncbi:MAG: TnpV protein [Firmicutes bacterium]|nr:TnpV protein [Bacillota bacterium]
MEKELKFIFDEKQFNDRQAELLKKIVTALAKGSDVINFSDYSEYTEELYLRWKYENNFVYALDEGALVYLRIAELPTNTIFVYDDYGKVRKDYLKYNYPTVYEKLKKNNILDLHLAYIDKVCYDEEDKLMAKMSKSDGITEELKDTNMLEWVGRRKNLRSRVREIVLEDMVYTAYSDNTSEEEQNG